MFDPGNKPIPAYFSLSPLQHLKVRIPLDPSCYKESVLVKRMRRK